MKRDTSETQCLVLIHTHEGSSSQYNEYLTCKNDSQRLRKAWREKNFREEKEDEIKKKKKEEEKMHGGCYDEAKD